MWDIHHDQFNSTLSKLSRRQILCKFHACHQAKDNKMNTYFTRLIDYRKQLSDSAEEISGESFVTHLFTYLPKEFATTINIFEGQALAPTSQHIMDAIRLDEEKAALVTEIGQASAGDALYSQRVYRGRGRGGSGRFGPPKTKWCTYRKLDNHTTQACGKRKRAKSGNGNSSGNDSSGGDNAVGSDMKACYHRGIPGHIRHDCIHYKGAKETRNTVR
jgi:hypothetical protein